MGVEGLDPLFGGGLHDHPPAALERFFDQCRQHTLERVVLQVVEQNFRHAGFAATCPDVTHHFS